MKKLKVLIISAMAVLTVAGLCACGKSTLKYEENGSTFTLHYEKTDGSGETTDEISCNTQDLWIILNSKWILNNKYYNFVGVTDSDGVQIFDENGYRVEGKEIKKGAQLTAQYTPKTFNLAFDARGSSVSTTTMSITYGSELETFEVPEPPARNMMFLGWYTYCYYYNPGSISGWQSSQITDSSGQVQDEYRLFKQKGYRSGNGYDFTYRRLEDDGIDDFDGTVTLFARWREVAGSTSMKVIFDYAIPDEWTFEANEKERNIEFGEVIESLPISTYDGNVIRAWTYEKGNIETEYDGEPIKKDTTLYALWDEYSKVGLYSQGEKLRDITLYKNEVVYTDNALFNIDRDGYELVGWYSNPELTGTSVTMVQCASAPTALYARWNKKEYTVFYNTAGTLVSGTNVERAFYDVESDTFSLYDLTSACPEHYTFLGWCADAELTTAPIKQITKGSFGDINLYPKFKGDDVTVTLNMQYTAEMTHNDGIATKTATVEYGSTYTIAPPANIGYSFLGWYSAPDGGECVADSTGRSLAACNSAQTFTLYARWAYRGEVVTVRYVDGNNNVSTQKVCVGDTLEFPDEPQKSGYEFVGWFNEDMTAEYYETDRIYGDITLYAKWVKRG